MDVRPVSRLSGSQLDDLYELYRNEWWTEGRTLEDVETMVRNTDEIVGFCESESGDLVAFARVLTDYVYQALVQDVIVAEPYRDRGLGKRVVTRVLEHPELESVDLVDLYCTPDLVPFYAGLGFTDELINDLRLMRYEGEKPD